MTWWQRKKQQALTRLGTFALDRIARSNQTRQHLSALPISLVAALIKGCINFLLLYRLATGHRLLDATISVTISAGTAFVSPVFYALVRQREADMLYFTNLFVDRVMAPNGLDFLLGVRNGTMLALAVCLIAFFAAVDVDSWYLIQLIVEYMVAFWVVDQVNQYRDSFYLPHEIVVRREFIPRPVPLQLTRYDLVRIPLRQATWAYAEPVPTVTTGDATKPSQPQQVAGSMIRIVDDYSGGV